MSGAASEEQTLGAAQQAVARAHGAMVTRTAAVRAAYPHLLGVAYGTAPRQTYDLYLPRAEPAGPVLVFLHGGGFCAGEAGDVGDHGLPYLQAGGIFVAMDYRLVPDTRFPESAADVERGLVAVRDEVRLRGGDPERIHLSGHSAGAVLAAQVGLRRSPGLDPDLVKGLVLISGTYDLGWQPEEVVDASHPGTWPICAPGSSTCRPTRSRSPAIATSRTRDATPSVSSRRSGPSAARPSTSSSRTPTTSQRTGASSRPAARWPRP